MPFKSTKLIIALLLIGFANSLYGQSLIVQKGVRLPADSLTANQLIASLNGFLGQKEKPNKENTYVLNEDLLATSALLDEIKGMDYNNATKENDFFKPYLTNVVKISYDDFIVQFSYIGINVGQPVLRASFRLIAKKRDKQYYFSSPLTMNTAWWKTKMIDRITYHFKAELPAADAKAFQKTLYSDNQRLQIPNEPMQFYYCDNNAEVLQLLGIDYKADYNGVVNDVFTSHENNKNLTVNGYSDSLTRNYAHDLWHNRLHSVVSVATINRPVDEGCAYLYGGSWGISWDKILAMFKKYAADNPNADWLALYISSQKLTGDNKPIYIAYILNALIVQKIEKEQGFSAALPLISCGKRQTGDDNYFAALDKVAGINKANFNEKMWVLVRAN
jgi:hypothetical protein